MRAFPSPRPVPARQRYRRVQRALGRMWLTPAWLTPVLVRAALVLVRPARGPAPLVELTFLVLDTLRCGPWNITTVGLAWHGRVVPVSWAVAPAPWPKKTFTPTVCAVLARVAAAWPAERAGHLLADRAFASSALFRTLGAAGWGWTVRLQARHWLTVDGTICQARTLIDARRVSSWSTRPAQYASTDKAVAGTLVLGRGLVVLPRHQRTAGSLRHRARRLGQRDQHAASKNQSRTAEYDRWVILFTTLPSARLAQLSYRRRWTEEGSYRDVQTGWDGQHGWDLQRVVPRLPTAAAVERVVGLWALATLLQSWLGDQLEQPTVAPEVTRIAAQWTTTGRLSVWARGQFALTEPSGQLDAWVLTSLAAGARRLRPNSPPARDQREAPPSPKKAA